MKEVFPNTAPEARNAMLLAHLSHEIRAPLTSIRKLVQGIAAGTMSSTLADEVEQAVQYLLNLSESYLHRVRAETQRDALPQEAFDLATVVREAIALVEYRADDKQLRLLVDWHSVQLHVTGSPLPVKQILVNLLSNGIKYTEKGHVRLAACVAPAAGGGSMLTLIVSDTGRGLNGQAATHAFEPFVRLHQEGHHTPGFGLGLAVVKELAEASGGDVMAMDAPDGGLQVLVTLKSDHVQAVPLALLQATTEGLVSSPPQPCGAGLPSRCLLPERHRGKSLLLVDDSAVNQVIVGDYLRTIGFEVLMAANGAEALEVLDREAIALVLTDLSMPVLDGHGLLQEIRRRGLTMPVVALTGESQPAIRLSCRQAGMAAYLTKPLDYNQALNDLVEALDNATAQKNTGQELPPSSDMTMRGATTRP